MSREKTRASACDANWKYSPGFNGISAWGDFYEKAAKKRYWKNRGNNTSLIRENTVSRCALRISHQETQHHTVLSASWLKETSETVVFNRLSLIAISGNDLSKCHRGVWHGGDPDKDMESVLVSAASLCAFVRGISGTGRTIDPCCAFVRLYEMNLWYRTNIAPRRYLISSTVCGLVKEGPWMVNCR